jgi:hypothetical protein
MASNDEHLANHLTACILGYHQFHLRLETNASVSLISIANHTPAYILGRVMTSCASWGSSGGRSVYGQLTVSINIQARQDCWDDPNRGQRKVYIELYHCPTW